MLFRVHHLDDEAIVGDQPSAQSVPAAFYDAKMGFKDDGSQEAACSEFFARGFYNLVATVEAPTIDRAWHLTNHVDRDWTLNPVCAAEAGPQRSSSVGDIFEAPDGKFFVCASIGFRALPQLGATATPSRKPRV